jgi:TetR/AcrR family transcriptional regulator, cholesterol catabolism regulator
MRKAVAGREDLVVAEFVGEPALSGRQLARRQRIVAAAMELAARGGYDAVQMRDVAAQAKVALGTLYRYFSSKDELLAFTWIEWSQDLQQQLVRNPLRGATPAARIMDFIRRATEALEREPRLASAILKSILSPDLKAEAPRRELFAVMKRVIETELEDLNARDRAGIYEILGHVWYANLLMWVSGRNEVSQICENLESACRLLIADR